MDSEETVLALKRIAEAYCKNFEITAYGGQFSYNLTSKKTYSMIDIQELSAETMLEKINQDELEDIVSDLYDTGNFV